MPVLTTADAVTLSTSLLVWWERHGRGGIPWKLLPSGVSPALGQDLNPYGIWIAEVMLQQTQLNVMLPYWKRWMTVFPTLENLVAASLDEVRLQWQGLGYYSRAVGCMRRRSCWWVDPGLARWRAGWRCQIGRTTAGSTFECF